MRRAAGAVLAAGLLVVVTGCHQARPHPTPSDLPPVSWTWRPVTLPVPPGPPGRLAVRDVVACGDQWYLGGGVATADGETRPAVWRSGDGVTWSVVPLAPVTYYGQRDVIYTIACRDGRLAAVGARSGGVHGNPRVATWTMRPDGGLAEVIAAFTQYGGEEAVNTARIVAGPAGWLIVGNRVSGAAVWTSPDSTEFTLRQGLPQLASEPGLDSAATDWVADGTGWVVVGGVQATGHVDRDPAAWTSPEGATWQRTRLPGTDAYEELQRVVALDGDLLAVGLAGSRFGAWQRKGGGSWQPAASFGSATGGAVSGIRSLATANGRTVAAVSDGHSFGLWLSKDRGSSWASLALPASLPAGADHAIGVGAAGDRWLLAGDDASSGRLWIADLSR